MSFALPIAPAVEVAEVLARGGPAGAALQLLALHPVEMAEALEPLEDDARVAIVAELPLHLAAQVLQNGDAAFRTGLLERLAPARLAQMLDRLPVEHAAQLLEQVDPDRQREILAESPADDVAQMRAIRSCPPSSVGRLMLRQVPRVQAHMTVRETLAFLRATASEMETINDLYILDEDRVLQGVVSLRQLVLAVPDAPLRDVMQTRVVRVAPETDREEAANLLSRYNFLALPVADESGRLLGVVTVDDLMDVLIQEGTEDLLHLGAVSGGDDAAGETSYWAGRITSAVKKRLGWLMLLFVAGSFTSQVLSHFHHELQAVVALSFFVPLLIGTGGNAGSQTVMTVVRGLALGEIRTRDTSRVLIREMLTGLLLGCLLGAVALVGALVVTRNASLGTVLAVSMVAVCTWSTCVGALIPITANMLKVDPTVASAPFISTFVDATGLLIYFLIARLMLHL